MKNKDHVNSLIESLKSECTTESERIAVSRLKKVFFHEKMVEIVDDNTQKFNGTIYRKMKGGF